MLRFILLCSCIFILNNKFFAQNQLLFNGETPNVQTCLYSYGNATNVNPHAGDWCFEAIPDPYHGPGIEMHCQNAWRVNLENYDYLQFWARCNQMGKTFNVSVYAYPHVSRGVNINAYVVGGSLDTTWRLVRMPIDSFKTPAFPMNSIDRLYFSGSPFNQVYRYYIDDIWAVDETPNKVDSLACLSNRALQMFIHERYDTTNAKTPSLYRISSTDDPVYMDTLNTQTVGMHWFCDDYADGASLPVPKNVYMLNLVLPQQLQNGKHYSLSVVDLVDMSGNHLAQPQVKSFVFQDDLYINGSVKVNQVGYLPVSRKYGYVGNYLGSAGMMPLSPSTFQVRNATTHAVAFSGTPNFRGNDTRLSGESVWDCNFTSLSTPGQYYLYVPGIGRSFPFEISDTVYDALAKIAGRGLFYQRCGGALDAAHAGIWNRPACHLNDGVIHSSCANTPLYNNETIGTTKGCTKGWHDAGDYGKYVASAAAPMYRLMIAYEMFPQKFGEDWNIPESGNGVPDVLDENKWELDWLTGMMADDGGVYFHVTTTYWPNALPHLDTPTRWLSQKTTHTTAQACALFAQAARVYAPFMPVFADSCLAKAKRAWGFLQKHPTTEPLLGYQLATGIGGGSYTDPQGDADERAWALAELYKTTGDTMYHNLFSYWYPQHEVTWGWNNFQHFQSNASFTYASTTNLPRNMTWVNTYKNSIKTGLDGYVKVRTDNNLYRNGYRSDFIPYISWGAYAHSTEYAWQFLRGAYVWPNDTTYLTYAKLNLDTQLGNNPQNMTYITGVGERSPMDPLQHTSYRDGIVPPNPGIPVFGPFSHLTNGNAWNAAAQNPLNLYPKGDQDYDPYPTLRRYYDIFELVGMSEFGVHAMTATTAVFARFSSTNVTCTPVTFYRDADHDGYGDANNSISACTLPPGYWTNNLDCNDNNAAIRPNAPEICGNLVDNDCDGTVDEGCMNATLSGGGTVCRGDTAYLNVSITGGISPYTIILSANGGQTTIPNYQNGAPIPVLPLSNQTYSLISATDAIGLSGSVSGTGSVSVFGLALSSCPTTITVNAPYTSCAANLTFPQPTITTPVCLENATLTNSFNNSSNASGAYPVGITTVVWTATMGASTATCSHKVTVRDIAAPAMQCVNNKIFATAADVNIALPASFVDNCAVLNLQVRRRLQSGTVYSAWQTLPGGAVPTGPNPFNSTNYGGTMPLEQGLWAFQYRATDIIGNAKVCQFTVKVIGALSAPDAETDAMPAPQSWEILVGEEMPAALLSDVTTAKEGEIPFSMEVSPNPNDGYCQVSLKNVRFATSELQILDNVGRILQRTTMLPADGQASIMLDLSALPSGVYFVHVFYGTEQRVAKMVKW